MPLMLFFQHNNLKSIEWAHIRRELAQALHKVDQAQPDMPPLADAVRIQILQTHIFEAALRVVTFFKPNKQEQILAASEITSPDDPRLTHDLSRAAYRAVLDKRGRHEFSSVLVGPIAIVSFPSVSPAHLKAALTILAPKAPDFPSPKRRTNPGYHELTTQSGLQKLLLLGARVEGKLFDDEDTRWVGKIEGGLPGLRAQLVQMLQGVPASLTGALEGAGKSLYLTLEGRRSALDDEENGKKE
jgi:ribosomal protein L10